MCQKRARMIDRNCLCRTGANRQYGWQAIGFLSLAVHNHARTYFVFEAIRQVGSSIIHADLGCLHHLGCAVARCTVVDHVVVSVVVVSIIVVVVIGLSLQKVVGAAWSLFVGTNPDGGRPLVVVALIARLLGRRGRHQRGGWLSNEKE